MIMVFRIILVIVLLIINTLLPLPDVCKLLIYIISYLLVGLTVVIDAIKNLFKRRFFDENFLMSLATIGALIINQYMEAVLVMLLYQIGELFQSYAVGKSRKSIASLMDIRPDYANKEIAGKLKKVDPKEIKIGDLIVVKAGEKIPLDGIIKKGSGLIDSSALTGESIFKKVVKGDEVLSGCINKNGLLTIKVTKDYDNSTVAKILDLVENASNKKAKTEKFITNFARYYTPIVVILAICLAFLPPLLIPDLTFTECLKRALTFLVISCPCALVISVPLGFFGGIGGASRNGILIKGSNHLEALAKIKTVIFDKTGTLTKGNFEVAKVKSVKLKENELLKIAALAESYSIHPIADSIKAAYKHNIDQKRVNDVNEIAGKGIDAIVDNRHVYVGNEKLMKKFNITVPKEDLNETVIYVAIDNEYMGYILIADTIKKEAKLALEKLKQENHIKKIIMLTGDNEKVASKVAKYLAIDKFYAHLLPIDKVNLVESFLKEKHEGNLAFIGDGINDAPVLTRCDVGIAMGALGSDAAIEAADVVIMDDNLLKLNTAISISKNTIKIVKQNIYFAIGIKILFLLLGSLGIVNMMEAVFADVGVSVIAILNSMRALHISKKYLK